MAEIPGRELHGGTQPVRQDTMRGSLRETAHGTFLTERPVWVFELAFPVNSQHDFGAARRSQ